MAYSINGYITTESFKKIDRNSLSTFSMNFQFTDFIHE